MNVPFATRDSLSEPTRARLTVDDYYAMAEAGLLDRFERTELIDGEILIMAPVHLPHARAHSVIFRALAEAADEFGNDLDVLFHVTTQLSRYDAPLPDIVVYDRAAAAGVTKALPGSAARLLVEVADSTSRHDLKRKRMLYAKRGVREYWVAVVRKRTIERFTESEGGDYRRHDSFTFGEAVYSLTMPGLVLPAGLLLDL